MIDVMSQAEDLESLDNLHALCTLMQTIRKSGGDTSRTSYSLRWFVSQSP